MTNPSGYCNSPWPGEDGGPQRLQSPTGISGLDLKTGENLTATKRRLMWGNMVLLRDPGEVYVMTIEMVRNRLFKLPVSSRIERIHPETGAEKGRVALNNRAQGAVFSSAGWGRDLYYLTLDKMARVFVNPN